jgi:hypothetical protein
MFTSLGAAMSAKSKSNRPGTLPLILLALGAAFSLSACDDERKPPMPQTGTQIAKAEPAQSWKLNSENPADSDYIRQRDASIAAHIEALFDGKGGGLSARFIDVDTSNGHVVLRGYALGEDARKQASELAKSVAGVRSVDNLLHVRT